MSTCKRCEELTEALQHERICRVCGEDGCEECGKCIALRLLQSEDSATTSDPLPQSTDASPVSREKGGTNDWREEALRLVASPKWRVRMQEAIGKSQNVFGASRLAVEIIDEMTAIANKRR